MALINKYGIAAVDLIKYCKFSKYVIQIYSNHAAKTGAPAVSRRRDVSFKVTISCIILNF